MQEVTKFTSIFLMHGREARFPLESKKLSAANLKMENVQERIVHLNQLKEDIFPIAKKNKQKSSIRRGREFLSLA